MRYGCEADEVWYDFRHLVSKNDGERLYIVDTEAAQLWHV